MNKKITLIDNTNVVDKPKIDDILDETKSILNEFNINRTIMNRVSSVAIESLDNIVKHSEPRVDKNLRKKYPSRFLLEKDGEVICLNTMNLILNIRIGELLSKLDEIEKLNHEDLVKLYKSTLTKAEISEKGGAGLGLITIAKLSRQRIKFDIKRINENFSYFMLQVKFNNIS